MDESESGELLGRAVAGFAWSLVNTVGSRAITMLIGLVMARLLAPADYGAFAVALVVSAVAQSLNELGVSVVVMRWTGPVQAIARTATTLSVGTSAALAAVIVAAAPHIAAAAGDASAAGVVRILALGVVIDGCSSTSNALLAREFGQKRRALADALAVVPIASVSIGLAAAGWGAESLAWGTVAGNTTAAVAVVALAPHRPRPGWSTPVAIALVRAGLPLAATSLAMLATLNIGYVVVGRALGSTQLGLYLLAFNLSSWPANVVSLAMRRVAVPAFARLRSTPDRLVPAFARTLHLVAGAALAAAVVLAVLSEQLITLLYGDRWAGAAGALRGLALFGGLRIVVDLGYDLLAALGCGRRLLAVQLVWFAALCAALPAAARWEGIAGVAWAHCVVTIAVVLPGYGAAIHRAGLSLGVLGRSVAWPLAAAVGAASVMLAGRGVGAAAYLGGVAVAAAGAVTFLGFMALAPQNWSAVQVARRRLGERRVS